MAKAHKGIVPTEAPAPYSDTTGINIGETSQSLGCSYLVCALLDSEAQVGTLTPLLSSSSCASSIHTYDDKALAC